MRTKLTPSAQYTMTVRMEYPHEPGWIGRISSVVGKLGGAIYGIDLVHIRKRRSTRDYSIECASTEHAERILDALRAIEGVSITSVADDTFLMHTQDLVQSHHSQELHRHRVGRKCRPRTW
jgi:malate dehydrogenase (oxaloacetate-decarboxylating)